MARSDESHGGAGYYLTLVAATLLMASAFIAGKVLLAANIPALLLLGWRFFVAALACLPLVLAAENSVSRTLLPPHLSWRDWLIVGLIGLLQTAATMGLLFLALRTISAGSGAILLFSNPLWVALIGHFVLRERLSGIRLMGLCCGITGIAVAIGATNFSHEPLIGQLTGLASAFCWAFATILHKKARLAIDAWALSFWQMLMGALLLLVVAYMQGEHWPAPALTSVRLWAWFVWLAIPASAGSFGLWFLALRRGGATQTSGYLFLVPLFTLPMSAVILGTGQSLLQALGGLLVGIALWLVNRGGPALPVPIIE